MQRAIELWKLNRNIYEPVDGKITLQNRKDFYLEISMSEGGMLTIREKISWRNVTQITHLLPSDLFAILEHYIPIEALEEVIQVKKEMNA